MLIQPLGQVPALLIGIGLGTMLGFLNSIIIISADALLRHEALFITFGLSSVYSAIGLIISNGETQQMFYITANKSIFETIGSKTIGIFTIPVILFIVLLVVFNVFHKKTYMGRAITLMGGNRIAAPLAGIPIKRCVRLVFSLTGFMASLTAIALFSRVEQVSPAIGTGYDLNAILAVVIGGTTLKGGEGSVLRTIFGVSLITVMSICLDLLGVTTHMKVVFTGTILVVAIWLDNRKELRRGY
jgi:ribose transport system permease protein